MRSSRRGLALLVVIGVLGVLVVLGVSFVTMARLERRASQQRLYSTQALLLARSGVEDALARLSAGQDVSLSPSAYGGENWDGSSDGLLSGWEAQQEVYRATGTGTPADVETCPVQHALRPSFFVGGGGTPATLAVDGRQRGYSGALMASAGGRNAYSLKVEDESAKIDVNGGFLDAVDRDGDGIPDFRDPFVADLTPAFPAGANGIGRGFNGQLARILGVLVSQPELGLPALPTAGTDILLGRPLGGYRSLTQVQAALGTAKDLSPWLTVSSWVDAKVVHPNAYTAQAAQIAVSEVKKTRLPLALEEGGRPPVNLNAASRPVLVALIQGLQAVSWQNEFCPQTCVIPSDMAAAISDSLLQKRMSDPFDTWEEFSAFCDGLVPDVIKGFEMRPPDPSGDAPVGPAVVGGNLNAADLLKANFDPNTDLNKQLPDQLVFRWVDKSDLTVWSTEGNLGPTGTFTVGAVGRVLDGKGRLAAERRLSLLAEAFRLLRQTTQQDFVGGRAQFQDYLSLASSPWRTTGASGPSWKTWPKAVGLAAMTYPCPPAAVQAGRASALDGAVALATDEMDPAPPLGGSLTFLHHFDDSWDADASRGAVPSLQSSPGNGDDQLQPDPAADIWPSSPGVEPNTLLPDGMHTQPMRSPSYRAQPNFPVTPPPAPGQGPTDHGALGFWVKPGKRGTDGKFEHLFSCVRTTAGFDTQVLLVGRLANKGLGAGQDVWGACMESAALNDDNGFESQTRSIQNGRLPGLRWLFMTVNWDTDEGIGAEQDTGCTLHSVLEDLGFVAVKGSDYVEPFHPATSQDLLDLSVLFALGGNTPAGDSSQFASAVLDEFAICDFGDAAALAKPACDAWALTRYRDGRYYKGEDALFSSAPLVPCPGARARLLSARWTAYLPAEGRMEVQNAAVPLALPRILDPRLSAASVSLSLKRADGSLRPLIQGGPIREGLAGFQYQAAFRTGIPAGDLPNTPVLETPFLDDVTFSWQRASGPRVLGWGAP